MVSTKLKEFTKKIIDMAAEEKLTVSELCCAADAVKLMAGNSLVDKENIEKVNFAWRYSGNVCPTYSKE